MHGREPLAKLLLGFARQSGGVAASLEAATVNGQPGGIARTADARIISVLTVDVSDGAVQAIRSVVNPDKLGHLGATADLRALLHGRDG